MGLEAAELARWTRFAAKGGIGKCTATCDCVAESADDLMFLKDDEIIVLLQLPEKDGYYLGYCEGVVGRFSGADVAFHSKLKKPVMARRQSVSAAAPASSTSLTTARSSTPTNSVLRSSSPATQMQTRHDGDGMLSLGLSKKQSKIQLHSRSQSPNVLNSSSSMDGQYRPHHIISPSASSSMSTSPVPARTPVPHKSHTNEDVNPPSSASAMSFSSLATLAGIESPLDSPSATTFDQSMGGECTGSPLSSRATSPPQSTISPLQLTESSVPLTHAASSTAMVSTSPLFTVFNPSSKRPMHAPPPLDLHRQLSSNSDIPSSSNTIASATSPLRITKRLPSNPSSPPPLDIRDTHLTSPLGQQISRVGSKAEEDHTDTGTPMPMSGASSSFFTAPTTADTHSAPSSSTNTILVLAPPSSPRISLSYSSTDPTPPPSALPSALDTSITTSSEYSTLDDLSKAHPGRFSRVSMGPCLGSLSLPALHGINTFPPSVLHPPLASGASFLPNGASTSTFASPPPSPRPPMQRTASSATLSGGRTISLSDAAIADTHAQVGIGLSLLQDLVGGMGSDSDSGSEYDDNSDDANTGEFRDAAPKHKSSLELDEGRAMDRQSKYSNVARSKIQAEVEAEAFAVALGRVGTQRGSVTVSEDGTVEGLTYDRSEDDHAQEQEASTTTTASHMPVEYRARNDQTTVTSTLTNATFLSSQNSPVPQTFGQISPQYTSPTSPVFPHMPSHQAQQAYAQRHNQDPNHFPTFIERSRRPSLAPSAASGMSVKSGASITSTVASGSWEGAAEIYDDYRYSRFSSHSVAAGSVSGVGRPSVDSVRVRTDSSGGSIAGRSRTESGSSAAGSAPRLAPKLLALVTEAEPADPRVSTSGPPKRTTLTTLLEKERTTRDRSMSVDSDVSVYTQNSRLSTLSRDIAAFSRVESDVMTLNSMATFHSNDTRPPPLSLSTQSLVTPEQSPLLHTEWASPASTLGTTQSALPPATSISAFTPVPGWVGAEGAPELGTAVSLNVQEHDIGSNGDVRTVENLMETGGIASAMRFKLEESRRSPPTDHMPNLEDAAVSLDAGADESGDSTTGLGDRIVVDDEEELPSKIIADDGEEFDEEGDTFVDEARRRFVDSPEPQDDEELKRQPTQWRRQVSESPEPELSRRNLAPLVVTNRTPSPRESDDDDQFSQRYGDSLQPEVSNKPSSPKAPLPPPSNTLPEGAKQLITTTQPPPSHVRPSNTSTTAVDGSRRSLFLPHPNAPKAPAGVVPNVALGPGVGVGAGPRLNLPPPPHVTSSSAHKTYAGQSAPQIQSQTQATPHIRPSLHTVILMALSSPLRPLTPRRGPLPLGPTIFGRTEFDLANSMGPVPIFFTIDPPIPPSKATAPGGVLPPPIGAGSSLSPDPSAAVIDGLNSLVPSSKIGSTSSNTTADSASTTNLLSSRSKPAPPPRSMSTDSRSSRYNSSTASSQETTGTVKPKDGSHVPLGVPIPRSNFLPKAAGFRPRSRSFSGFNSTSTHVTSLETAIVDSTQATKISPGREVKRALSSTALNVASPKPSKLSSTPIITSTTKPVGKSSTLRPSPLSLSSISAHSDTNNERDTRHQGKSPTPKQPVPPSPLAQSVTNGQPLSPESHAPLSSPSLPLPSPSLSLPPSPGFGGFGLGDHTSRHQLRQMSSRTILPDSSPTTSTSISSLSATGRPGPTARANSAASDSSSTLARSRARADSSSMISISTSDFPTEGGQTRVVSPPPGSGVHRQNSLRAKLSLPNLRRNRSKPDDETGSGAHERDLRERHRHGEQAKEAELDLETEMLQVQDMAFELVRPNFTQIQAARTSEDAGFLRRDGSFDLRPDGSGNAGSLLRPESPAVSVSTTMNGTRSPTNEGSTSGGWTPQTHPSAPAGLSVPTRDTESPASMEAHRQREQKWVSLMSSSPASLSRKSKKVKKLLVEGVPSSVRYLVWSYLTDGKGRAVKGVFEQLCKRGEVGRTAEIMTDVDRLFGGENEGMEHLSGTKGPVIVLLQAYLSMVPDVQYSTGLTKIVGQLLLLAPEEDAFWIFVSIMDTHIRPYFSLPIPSSSAGPSPTRSTQVEVDAALFSRALEANDPQLAKKIFVDMGILPGVVCQPWLSTLYVGTLPPQYLNRVWDIFLYDGIPFLLRVALTLTIVCRRHILSSANSAEQSILSTLARPPQAWLPPTPEAFLVMVIGLKLKDDDVRKQRVKMGELIKRQNQAQAGNGLGPGGISLPRA